jgi:DDE superfamily endonuclease
MDDTIERRWGPKIAARGIYRDPVRSTHGHFVKASGLRWLSLMVAVPIPFIRRRWALPFLTILAPSQRWSTERSRRHKRLTDWARQAVLQTKRWLANRAIIIVADSSFSALELIASVRQHVCFVTRLRLDANLFAPAPARRSGQRGRQPKKGRQLPKLSKVLTNRTTRWTKIGMPEWYGGERHTLEIVTGTAIWYHSGLSPVPIRWLLVRDPSGVRDPQAFLCTDLDATPAQILGWFVQRWSIETTFQEVRDHLGVETQRQWSDLAILRTTPALLGLYSLITIWANTLAEASGFIHPRAAAWYTKSELTFSDAIAAVRRALWSPTNFSISRKKSDMVEIPAALLQRLTDTLCYAA